MNHERNGKLLTVAGSQVLTRRQKGAKCLKRPDGGVVTQRTANPLSLAHFRDSLHFRTLARLIGFREGFVPSANSEITMTFPGPPPNPRYYVAGPLKGQYLVCEGKEVLERWDSELEAHDRVKELNDGK